MSDTVKKPLIIIAGPTAVGKTDFSIDLAKAVGGEIISADSSQVFKGLDIASAKIRKEEMQGVRHHLIDILEPTEEYSVYEFQKNARSAMEEIYSRGHIPIIAGGTGFYIQSVLYDVDFEGPDLHNAYTESLERIARDEGEAGTHRLHEMLAEVDPESARINHENNIRRVIRALSFYHETGTKLSDHNAIQHEKESTYNFAYFVLTMDRAKLYERIDRRVDLMMEAGALEEVAGLRAAGITENMASMKGIGYKELYGYLEDRYDLATAVEKIKLNTRHFAKRQLTWFRREKEVTWLDKDQYPSEADLLAAALAILKEKNIVEEA